jgi:hypothetical protein
VLLNFDDVIFPTHALQQFYDHDTMTFIVPPPIQDQLNRIDTCIYKFVSKHLANTRFILICRSSAKWIRVCTRHMKYTSLYIAWNYIDVVRYEHRTRYALIHDLLSKTMRYNMYIFLGYAFSEDNCIPSSIRKNEKCSWRVLNFVRRPSVYALVYQWERMDSVFQRYLTSKDRIITKQFIVEEDCQQPHGSPGWYAVSPPIHSLYLRSPSPLNLELIHEESVA